MPASPRQSISEIVHTFTGSLTSDGDAGLRVAGFIPQAHPLRRPVAEHFPGYFNTVIPSQQPPEYDDIQDQSLPPPRFPIAPREEEGREQLPQYSCSIHREAVLLRKMELSSPFHRAKDRGWKKQYAVLHGTLLKIHKAKRFPFFAKPEDKIRVGEDGSALPLNWLPGELVRSYTLQGAEVGIAGDYRKRHFVIRVRAETEQFLFSVKTIQDFLGWLEDLSAAVDLSPSLEERALPRYQTIPRRRRRRNGAQVIRQQERIIRSQYPQLIDGSRPGAVGEAVGVAGSRRGSVAATANEPSGVNGEGRPPLVRASSQVTSLQESLDEQDLRELRAEMEEPQAQNANPASSPLSGRPPTRPPPLAFATSSSSSSSPPSSSSGDGQKWSPRSNLTAEANLRYARRCMAILCGDAPRQSDFVVKDGKRYRLLWEKKVMVPEEWSSGVGAPGGRLGPAVELEMQVGVVIQIQQQKMQLGKIAELPSYEELFSDLPTAERALRTGGGDGSVGAPALVEAESSPAVSV